MPARRALLCLVFVACASSGGSGSSLGGSRDVTIVGGGGLRLWQNQGAKVVTLSFPMQRVWTALPAAFDSLGIALTDLDAAKHIIGNAGFKPNRTIGKTPLSQYIDCGSTQGFPSADSYDVQMSVMTQIDTAPSGATLIATMVEAAGKPLAFPGSYTKCSTKETIENRIVEIVTARLSR